MSRIAELDAYSCGSNGRYEKLYFGMLDQVFCLLVGYNVVCGILRGLGDSKTPLYFVGLACVINIVLDFILVGLFPFGGYREPPLATITAQGGSFVISLWFLHGHGFHFEFTRTRYPA